MEKICTNCENCIIDAITHDFWVEYDFKCKKEVININHITGDITYGNCYVRNVHGDCKNFEPKTYGFKKWFKLFKNKK